MEGEISNAIWTRMGEVPSWQEELVSLFYIIFTTCNSCFTSLLIIMLICSQPNEQRKLNYYFFQIVMISSEAEEELVVVESVYCVGGEFHRLDDRTIKIRSWDILQRIFKNLFSSKNLLGAMLLRTTISMDNYLLAQLYIKECLKMYE